MQTIRINTIIHEYNSPEELDQTDRTLIIKAKEVSLKAYAPYSEFKVGASVLLENGEIICGNNQENAAYPSGLCAERVALFYANAKYPDQKVIAMAIVARKTENITSQPVSPCGSCRQVMIETEQKFHTPIRLILAGEEKIQILDQVEQLLPLGFNKKLLLGKKET